MMSYMCKNVMNAFTFLSSTTTSVLCLLMVCGRDNLLRPPIKELRSQPPFVHDSDDIKFGHSLKSGSSLCKHS